MISVNSVATISLYGCIKSMKSPTLHSHNDSMSDARPRRHCGLHRVHCSLECECLPIRHTYTTEGRVLCNACLVFKSSSYSILRTFPWMSSRNTSIEEFEGLLQLQTEQVHRQRHKEYSMRHKHLRVPRQKTTQRYSLTRYNVLQEPKQRGSIFRKIGRHNQHSIAIRYIRPLSC